MDYSLEVVIVPVADVDRSLAFYTERAGFSLDVDYAPAGDFRVVQLTPPGSACSVQIGVGLTDAVPGSLRNLHLVVGDVERARRELTERGAAAQVARRGLEGRFPARGGPRAPRLRQFRRLRRPGRQHLDRAGARIPQGGLNPRGASPHAGPFSDYVRFAQFG
ncbi:glyoxalase [Streptomyces sp. NPDC058864]